MAKVGPASVLAFTATANYQPVGDGAVILLTDSGQLYTCNSTSEALLRRVDGSRSLSEIASDFCVEFEVEVTEATTDIVEIARDLVREGILEVVG